MTKLITGPTGSGATLLTAPAVGWYSGSTTGMYFNGGF